MNEGGGQPSCSTECKYSATRASHLMTQKILLTAVMDANKLSRSFKQTFLWWQFLTKRASCPSENLFVLSERVSLFAFITVWLSITKTIGKQWAVMILWIFYSQHSFQLFIVVSYPLILVVLLSIFSLSRKNANFWKEERKKEKRKCEGNLHKFVCTFFSFCSFRKNIGAMRRGKGSPSWIHGNKSWIHAKGSWKRNSDREFQKNAEFSTELQCLRTPKFNTSNFGPWSKINYLPEFRERLLSFSSLQ